MAEQSDQNDDRKGDAEQQKYNRAHLKLLNQSESISEIIDERACTPAVGSGRCQLNHYNVIPLSSSDGRGEARAKRAKQEGDEDPQ